MQLSNCKNDQEFLKAAADIIGANPNCTTINQVHKQATRNRRVRATEITGRINAARQGIKHLRSEGHDKHIRPYVRQALVNGEPCPKKFLQSVG